MNQNNQHPGSAVCIYPKCNCPFDAPIDPNWCARGLPHAAPSPQVAEELPNAAQLALDAANKIVGIFVEDTPDWHMKSKIQEAVSDAIAASRRAAGGEAAGFHIIYDNGTSVDYKATAREAHAHARALVENGWQDVNVRTLIYAVPTASLPDVAMPDEEPGTPLRPVILRAKLRAALEDPMSEVFTQVSKNTLRNVLKALAAQPAEGSAQVATHFSGWGGKWIPLPEGADPEVFRDQGYAVGTPEHGAISAAVVRAAPADARYRFLLSFLLERGVLHRYDNGVWRLRGIYGVDDSGLKGAGRTPEEALDNAIIAVNLDPITAEKFWRASCEAVIAAEGATPAGELVWQPLTEPGQVIPGTKLRFTIGDQKFNETAKVILNPNAKNEEIIYNKARNFYLITSLAISGKGNAKNVEFLGPRIDGDKHGEQGGGNA